MPYKSTLQWNRGFLEFCWQWGEYYSRDEHLTKKSTQSSAVKLNKELAQGLGEGETVEFRGGLTKLTPPQTSSWSESAKPNMACGYLEGCFFLKIQVEGSETPHQGASMAWPTILNMVCGLYQDGLNNSVSSKGLRSTVTYPNGSDGDKWTDIGLTSTLDTHFC